MSLIATPFRGRRDLPQPPVEIADEVEKYARLSGRHAKLHFVPNDVLRKGGDGTWVVSITLRPTDKRMRLWQENKVSQPPTEDIWLHVPDPKDRTGYRSLKIEDLGASGVKEFLERGNTWSGRGEFSSIEEQARKAMEANAKMREKNRQEQKEASRKMALDQRRRRLKIPFLPVGIDLSTRRSEV